MRPINQIVFNVVFISTLKTQKERATPSLHMLTFAELAISMCKNCPLPSMSHFYSSNIATSISQYTIVIVYSLLLSTLCIVHYINTVFFHLIYSPSVTKTVKYCCSPFNHPHLRPNYVAILLWVLSLTFSLTSVVIYELSVPIFPVHSPLLCSVSAVYSQFNLSRG